MNRLARNIVVNHFPTQILEEAIQDSISHGKPEKVARERAEGELVRAATRALSDLVSQFPDHPMFRN